jgi:hypothetical protein
VASPPSDGRRDLSLIRASGSTARVLNLALVYERFGESSAFETNPLFRSPKLNRALIIKHALRDHERALFERPEPHTTKIVFPFSATELELGGTSLMVGERGFEQSLRQVLGASADPDDFAADFELIALLHELPSFDPFLLKEQLKRGGHEPAACFFDVSEADIGSMLAFVQQEIAPLVVAAFDAGGRRAEKLSMRLAQKLMTDGEAQMLAPLRDTMKLGAGEFAEGVFAWKGFLYYKWMLRAFVAAQEDFATRLATCSIACETSHQRYEVGRSRRDVLQGVERVGLRVAELIAEYDRAFAALVRGDPLPFRSFLRDAPAQFIPLGEATGAVKHIYSFWGFRFSKGAGLRLEAAEGLEILQEFARMLSGLQLLKSNEVVL